jgi:hypothetical protein
MRLTDGEAQMPAVLPDGSRVAFYYREAGTTAPWALGVMPFAGGPMKDLIRRGRSILHTALCARRHKEGL